MTVLTRERPHGYARYKLDSCRCDVCRKADSAYRRREQMSRTAGTWQPFVDAGPVRAHLAVLSAAGIGYKRAADLAGLSRSVVNVLLYGKGDRPPSVKVRPETAEKLLAVRPDRAELTPGALVSIVGAARRAQALACMGWSLTRQAARIGWTVENYSATLLHRLTLTVRSDQAIRRLYDELSMSPAPAGCSATRARNEAHRRGWFGPLAWDDDTIDDPSAYPAVMPPIGLVVPGADELAIQHAAAGHIDPVRLDELTKVEWVRRMRSDEHTYAEIGGLLGVSGSRVQQLAAIADGLIARAAGAAEDE